MKIDESEHKKQPWKVHSLLNDFKVEDVWLLPIELVPEQNLNHVLSRLEETNKNIAETGLTGQLFKIRLFLGKVFNWDDSKNTKAEIVEGKIRERYIKAEHLAKEDLPKDRISHFTPVYYLQDETLLEVENNLLQAAIHLGKIILADTRYGVQMTVYVKPKGIFSRLYMLAIKPFRVLIVYPMLMKTLKLQWDNYMKLEKFTKSTL